LQIRDEPKCALWSNARSVHRNAACSLYLWHLYTEVYSASSELGKDRKCAGQIDERDQSASQRPLRFKSANGANHAAGYKRNDETTFIPALLGKPLLLEHLSLIRHFPPLTGELSDDGSTARHHSTQRFKLMLTAGYYF
jgi:hypothetical protein